MDADLRKRIQHLSSTISTTEDAGNALRFICNELLKLNEAPKQKAIIDVDDIQLSTNLLRIALQFWGSIKQPPDAVMTPLSSACLCLSEEIMKLITANAKLLSDEVFVKLTKVLGFAFSRCNKMILVRQHNYFNLISKPFLIFSYSRARSSLAFYMFQSNFYVIIYHYSLLAVLGNRL